MQQDQLSSQVHRLHKQPIEVPELGNTTTPTETGTDTGSAVIEPHWYPT